MPFSLDYEIEMRSYIKANLGKQTEVKTSPVDCGSDHELLIAKYRLKLKKVGKITRPFRYDLNQSVHGILQARTLEWVAISFSRGSSQPRKIRSRTHA